MTTTATTIEKEAPRGRPVTGKAKTATERGKAADDALLGSGGRILSRLRLSLDAAAALSILSKKYGSDRTAIEKAIIQASKSH